MNLVLEPKFFAAFSCLIKTYQAWLWFNLVETIDENIKWNAMFWNSAAWIASVPGALAMSHATNEFSWQSMTSGERILCKYACKDTWWGGGITQNAYHFGSRNQEQKALLTLLVKSKS